MWTLRKIIWHLQRKLVIRKGKGLLNCPKWHEPTIKLFSDKNNSIIDAIVNRLNNRYIARARSEVEGFWGTKDPAQVMALSFVAFNEKSLHFFKHAEK